MLQIQQTEVSPVVRPGRRRSHFLGRSPPFGRVSHGAIGATVVVFPAVWI